MVARLLFMTVVLAGAQPAFEVASVRPSAKIDDTLSKGGRPAGLTLDVSPNRFSATNVNLLVLILRAYGITGCRPFGEGTCSFVSGGPDWLQKDHFDVQAKIPDGFPAYNALQLQLGHAPELALMLQALLADRFHFKAHRETREIPIYALTIAKKGHRLKPPTSSKEGIILFRPVEENGQRGTRLEGTNSTMADLCDLYSKFADRRMIDQTGLKDKFDFTATYESDPLAPGPFSPDLFRAFQDELGLKVEATKGPVEILVIDHAGRPTAN